VSEVADLKVSIWLLNWANVESVEMQWSKIKSRAESFICDSLKGRIEFFSTWYRDSGKDHIGRATILLDKKEVFEADTWKRIFNRNEFERLDLHDALIEYPLLAINEALSSENPIIRGLAMVDKRFGKRSLREIKLDKDEHEFVKLMFNLRCETELN
jgi:hypothetical protein